MNVAELTEALIELESDSKFRRDSAHDELSHYAAILARRVIAAEKLVEALKEVSQTLDWRAHGCCRGWSDNLLSSADALEKSRNALTAYEATK